MFYNNLIIALRQLRKHKVYSAINLLGLAIGLAAGFLILQYVAYELSYDQFFDNKENIYRVRLDRTNKGVLNSQWAAGCAGVGQDLHEDFPEVTRFVRLRQSKTDIKYDEQYYKLDDTYYCSEDFFSMFSIPLLSGIDTVVLRDPYTAVLSESVAQKIFKGQDPIGERLKVGDRWEVTVTGVFKDLPENSHMQFDVLYSYETYVDLVGAEARTNWMWDGFLTYIELFPGTNPADLEAKFPGWILQHEGERLTQFNEGMAFYLQPLHQIHLISNYRMEIKPNGDKVATYLLAGVGLFVLIIAWINYINLTTARAIGRAKEVGVRKALGSSRSQLVGQFMFESGVMNLIALVLAAGLILYLFPIFNEFAGKSTAYTWPSEITFWTLLGTLFFGGVLASGFYPAVVLSGFRPFKVLRGSFTRSKSGHQLRQGLVVFQFFASIILITGTFVVFQQMQHLQSQELGIDMDRTLVIETPDFQTDSIYNLRFSTFESLLRQESFVKDMTEATNTPGRTPAWNAGGIRLTSQTEEEANQYRVIGQDASYIDFFGLEVISGRAFDESFGTESTSVILNEEAAKQIGVVAADQLIGEKLFFWGDTFNIVGVVKNYRQESPKAAHDALIFRYFDHPGGYYAIRLDGSNVSSMISTLENHWQQAYTHKPFHYFFLDDYYNDQYKAEIQFGSIFGLFSGLAIFVACLGLFGLASFMTSLRIKEISIRKVLGANQEKLWSLLTADFMKLVGLAIALSLPLSYYLMNQWLENFATRIGLNVWLFLIPAVMLVVIAIFTVSYHTIRAIRTNPAQNLKCE